MLTEYMSLAMDCLSPRCKRFDVALMSNLGFRSLALEIFLLSVRMGLWFCPIQKNIVPFKIIVQITPKVNKTTQFHQFAYESERTCWHWQSYRWSQPSRELHYDFQQHNAAEIMAILNSGEYYSLERSK